MLYLVTHFKSIHYFGELTFDLKSLFLIQQTNHFICSQCNQQITKSTDVVVLYITHQHIHQNGFESSVSEAMLPNINKLFYVHCQNHQFWKCCFTTTLCYFANILNDRINIRLYNSIVFPS